MYGKGCLFFLMDSIFSSITTNLNSIYLIKGNEYRTVNSLITCLFESIYESTKMGYYDDNDINRLIETLYDIIKEYVAYSSEINYILFVKAYCDKFKNKENNEKMYLICQFFKGLNPLNFESTFKEIDYIYGKDHFDNIEIYYNQINKKINADEISSSSEEINETANNINNETSFKFNDDIKKKDSKFKEESFDLNTISENQSEEKIKEKDNENSNEASTNEDEKRKI